VRRVHISIWGGKCMKTRDQVVHFPLTHIHTRQSLRHMHNPPTPISMTFPHDLCLISPPRKRERNRGPYRTISAPVIVHPPPRIPDQWPRPAKRGFKISNLERPDVIMLCRDLSHRRSRRASRSLSPVSVEMTDEVHNENINRPFRFVPSCVSLRGEGGRRW
jgi:hypothetical protein